MEGAPSGMSTRVLTERHQHHHHHHSQGCVVEVVVELVVVDGGGSTGPPSVGDTYSSRFGEPDPALPTTFGVALPLMAALTVAGEADRLFCR